MKGLGIRIKDTKRLVMKRLTILSVMLMISSLFFAKDFEKDFANSVKNSKILNDKKLKVEVIQNWGKDDFIKKRKQYINTSIFPDEENITYEMLLMSLKEYGYIYEPPFDFYSFSWGVGKNLSYSVEYSQRLWGPIQSLYTYLITVFYKDRVYLIRLSDSTDLSDRNKEYDKLKDIFIFKEGQKMDISRGIEGDQGYYFVNDKVVEKFYDMLVKKDRLLPKSAIRFQRALEAIEEFLNDYE